MLLFAIRMTSRSCPIILFIILNAPLTDYRFSIKNQRNCRSDSSDACHPPVIFLGMPTFARVTFNTATYAPFHPTYPRQLFDVFKYHESSSIARWNTAVDLEVCKPTFSLLVSLNQCVLKPAGRATVELIPFKRVIGVDPSARNDCPVDELC